MARKIFRKPAPGEVTFRWQHYTATPDTPGERGETFTPPVGGEPGRTLLTLALEDSAGNRSVAFVRLLPGRNGQLRFEIGQDQTDYGADVDSKHAEASIPLVFWTPPEPL